MKMKTFALNVLKALEDLDKIPDKPINNLNIEVKDESEKTQKDLRLLLRKLASSKGEISNEDSLTPFFVFLGEVSERTVAIKKAFKSTKGGQYCEILVSHMIAEADKFENKTKNMEDLLTQPIYMDSFARKALHQLEKIEKRPIDKMDPIVYLQSEVDIEILKKKLYEYQNSKELVTLQSLQPFITFIGSRALKIAGSEHEDKSTNANQIYNVFTQFVRKAVNFNTTECLDDENIFSLDNNLLEIKINANVNERIREEIFVHLENEKGLLSSKQLYTNQLQKMEMNTNLLVNYLLSKMDCLNKDDIQKMSLDVYRESKYTVTDLKKLLMHFCDENIYANKSLSGEILSPLINFLKNRWDDINGSEAADEKNANSEANQICKYLVDYISLAGYKIVYLNRDREKLLRPPHYEKNNSGDLRLKLRIVRGYANDEEMLVEMSQLDKSKWLDFVTNIPLDNFIKLMSNNKATRKEDLLQVASRYNDNENRSKAILFCLHEIYKIDRNNGGSYASSLAWAASYIVTIPTLEQKNKFIDKLQMYLIDDNVNLFQLQKELNDSQSELGKLYQIAMKGTALPKFVAEIYRAADALTVSSHLKNQYKHVV